MTRFTLQEALGSETHYNNLITGSVSPGGFPTSTNLTLVGTNGSYITILGQSMTYNFAIPSVTGGEVLSIHVYDNTNAELLAIENLPAQTQAAGLFTDFVSGGLANLFNTLSLGNDTFIGNSFANTLNGGGGRDNILAGAGADRVSGGAGYDTLRGGADNDTMSGGLGFDFLFGGSGDDSLQGGVGNDRVSGGTGMDRFVFRAGEGRDTFTDFDPNGADQDHIIVTQAMLNGMSKHLVTDAVTHQVLGLRLDFENALHTSLGSIMLEHVVRLAAIDASDFIIG